MTKRPPRPQAHPRVEAVVLAGGLSSRMGRNKALIRLGGKTLLAWVRIAAHEAGLKCRVIRKDLVPKCGPVGGVLTALLTTKADVCLFLACDMPMVSPAYLRRMIGLARSSRAARFTRTRSRYGFPFLVWKEQIPALEAASACGDVSLQTLARSLRARGVDPRRHAGGLVNANTPAELALLTSRFSRKAQIGKGIKKPRKP